jgi:hypothetical protein
MIEKGSELQARLLKDDSLSPNVKEILIKQQQDIFFLRKTQLEQATIIDQLIDSLTTVMNCNASLLEEQKKRAEQNQKAMKNDLRNEENL